MMEPGFSYEKPGIFLPVLTRLCPPSRIRRQFCRPKSPRANHRRDASRRPQSTGRARFLPASADAETPTATHWTTNRTSCPETPRISVRRFGASKFGRTRFCRAGHGKSRTGFPKASGFFRGRRACFARSTFRGRLPHLREAAAARSSRTSWYNRAGRRRLRTRFGT